MKQNDTSLNSENTSNVKYHISAFSSVDSLPQSTGTESGQPPLPVSQTPVSESAVSREMHFHALALPALVYAVLTTIFLYKNFSGITLPLYVITAAGFILTATRRLRNIANIKNIKKGYFLYTSGMLLLALSICRTDNDELIFYGNLMIFILTVGLVLYLFYREEGWTPFKHITAFFIIGFEMIAAIGDFFSDTFAVLTNTKREKSRNILYLLIGFSIFLPLSAVILALLSSADAVFGQLITSLTSKILVDGNIIFIICFFLGAFTVSYCGLRAADKHLIPEEVKDHRKAPVLVACTILLPLSLIYLLFSGIQIFSLFLGKMQLPAGYTYAEYAREGFFQLLIVCLINVCLVLVVQGLFHIHAFLKILLTLVSACTYIMLASSALRLFLYIKVYHLTMLRIEVIWSLAVIAVCMALVMITVFYPSFPLMRSSLIVITTALSLLILVRPDGIIAKYNLSHLSEETDFTYLSSLSADAAPYIYGQEGDWVDSYIQNLCYDSSGDSLLRYNFSRGKARKLFRKEITEAKETLTYYLFNNTNGDISDVSWTVLQDGNPVLSEEEYFGDGSEIVYSNDGISRDDACMIQFTRYDLASVLEDDGTLPDDLSLEIYWITDGIGYGVSWNMGSCNWNDIRDLSLTGSWEGNYSIDN